MANDCGWRALLKLPNILFWWSFPYCTCKVRDSGRRLCVVIVAEGAQEDSGNPVTSNHIREVRILVITKFPCELSATTYGHLSITTTCLQRALAWQAFPCGLGTNNEERESKTARKIARVKEEGGGGEEWKETLTSAPSPPSSFHCVALVSFLVSPKPKIPFLCLFFCSGTERKHLLRRLVDSPCTVYWLSHSCLNSQQRPHLFIRSTFFCMQGRYWGEVQLYWPMLLILL